MRQTPIILSEKEITEKEKKEKQKEKENEKNEKNEKEKKIQTKHTLNFLISMLYLRMVLDISERMLVTCRNNFLLFLQHWGLELKLELCAAIYAL